MSKSLKGKVNPYKECFCCGQDIFNKHISAKYCSDCTDEVTIIRKRITVVTYHLRNRFKRYKIKVAVEIKVK